MDSTKTGEQFIGLQPSIPPTGCQACPVFQEQLRSEVDREQDTLEEMKLGIASAGITVTVGAVGLGAVFGTDFANSLIQEEGPVVVTTADQVRVAIAVTAVGSIAYGLKQMVSGRFGPVKRRTEKVERLRQQLPEGD